MSLTLSRVGNPKKLRKRADDDSVDEIDPMSLGSTLSSKRAKSTAKAEPSSASFAAMTSARALQSSVSSAPFRVPLTKQEKSRRKERMERFAGDKGKSQNNKQKCTSVDPLYQPLSSSRESKDPGYTVLGKSNSPGPLVGENQSLEKPYLRLTTHPRKEDVRPLRVLVKSLAHIKSRYVQDEDFSWANEQLKSVRQDLTVQQIRNRFVLDVYETHARILLENGDLDEFNQCQTMIRSLTEGKRALPAISDGEVTYRSSEATAASDGSDDSKPLHQSPECADEFRGYSILYAYVRNSWMDLKTELARCPRLLPSALLKATPTSSESPPNHSSCTLHAVSVVRSMDDHDYQTFFRLYRSAPHMSAYLMDFLVKRVRDQAYRRIVSAHRPNVGVEYLRECLHFDDLEETRRFLTQCRAVFVDEVARMASTTGKNRRRGGSGPSFWVDCKASSANILRTAADGSSG